MIEFSRKISAARRGSLASRTGLVCLVLAGLSLAGCGRHGLLSYVRDLTGPPRGEIAAKAFSAEDADVRRESIVVMTERPWGLRGAALRGYALVARTSGEEPTVRSVAVRALGLAGEEARPYVDDILVALGDEEDALRWDAAVALDNIPAAEESIPALCVRTVHDRSVDVRIACARALRHYRRRDVGEALVDALGDSDFAVRLQARRSLVEIIGHDYGPDPSDWVSVAREMPPREEATCAPRGVPADPVG